MPTKFAWKHARNSSETCLKTKDQIPTSVTYNMTKKRLKTFSYIRKKISASNLNNCKLTGMYLPTCRPYLVADSRHLLTSDEISHPLGLLPWALANGDGTLKNTNKADRAQGRRSGYESGGGTPTDWCVTQPFPAGGLGAL